jgi:plastocyanin
MPSTSKPVCGEAATRRARRGLIVSVVMLMALSSYAWWHTASVAAPVQSGRTHVVAMEAMKFSPAELTIRLGDEVTFKNHDLVPHTATAKGHFDSGPVNAGATWSVKPAKAGAIRYTCTFHPMMEGVIKVSERAD